MNDKLIAKKLKDIEEKVTKAIPEYEEVKLSCPKCNAPWRLNKEVIRKVMLRFYSENTIGVKCTYCNLDYSMTLCFFSDGRTGIDIRLDNEIIKTIPVIKRVI